MMYKRLSLFFFLSILLLIFSCLKSEKFVIRHQVSGSMETNCYLLYNLKSKEAALFDVGGSIDSLELVINENNLNLKYIFITHAHPDHIQGLPDVLKKYPKAKLCFSKEEYEDMTIYPTWETAFPPEEVAEMKKYPKILETMNFDYCLVGEPDIFWEDDKIYKLDDLNIRTFLSPGHSRGSICFHVENVLISGDVLFYRRVG